MGFYVEPIDCTPTCWCEKNAQRILRSGLVEIFDVLLAQNKLPVILIDQGSYMPAGIAYSKRELIRFLNPLDNRPKLCFVADIARLKEVSPFIEDAVQEAKEMGF